MSVQISTERRMLRGAEFETVARTHYPDIFTLSKDELAELQRYGLIAGKPVGGTTYFDEESLIVANLAAGFMRFGVEARHLRMYKSMAEREANFFEQVVQPVTARRAAGADASDALAQLASLGGALRETLLRQALGATGSA
jgi:hypothetical protein